MALNIFPRRRDLEEAVPAAEPEQALPEPSAEALEEPRRRTRTRGGRGRSRGAADAVNGDAAEAGADDAPAEPMAIADGETDGDEAAPAPRRRRRGGGRSTAATDETVTVEDSTEPAADATAEAEAPAPAPARTRRKPAATAATATAAEPAATGNADLDGLLRALQQQQRQLEQQSRQIEQLLKLQEDGPRRGSPALPGGTTSITAVPPARVAVFVDSANIELACDRLRARFDWAKVLRMFTQDRQLVRALAYSPVHDDPGVSIETQRFVEPFLDKGYKVVTKPLRRFHDGSIKANLDIELALDVLAMVDRLDVVILVSGDGDFQKLVEVVQSHGVRCEVAAVGSSTATNLKYAADSFIDLASRTRELRA